MNEVTERSIRGAIAEYGGAGVARRFVERAGDFPTFDFNVQAAYWQLMMIQFGISAWTQAMGFFKAFRPDLFGTDGFLTSDASMIVFKKNGQVYDLEEYISALVQDRLDRFIDANPEMQLGSYTVDQVQAILTPEPVAPAVVQLSFLLTSV